MSTLQVPSAISEAEQYTQELKEQFDRLAGPDADSIDGDQWVLPNGTCIWRADDVLYLFQHPNEPLYRIVLTGEEDKELVLYAITEYEGGPKPQVMVVTANNPTYQSITEDLERAEDANRVIQLYQLPALLKQLEAPTAGQLGEVTNMNTTKGKYSIALEFDEVGKLKGLIAYVKNDNSARIHIEQARDGDYHFYVIQANGNPIKPNDLYWIDVNGKLCVLATNYYVEQFEDIPPRIIDFQNRDIQQIQDLEIRETIRQTVFDFVKEMLS